MKLIFRLTRFVWFRFLFVAGFSIHEFMNKSLHPAGKNQIHTLFINTASVTALSCLPVAGGVALADICVLDVHLSVNQTRQMEC